LHTNRCPVYIGAGESFIDAFNAVGAEHTAPYYIVAFGANAYDIITVYKNGSHICASAVPYREYGINVLMTFGTYPVISIDLHSSLHSRHHGSKIMTLQHLSQLFPTSSPTSGPYSGMAFRAMICLVFFITHYSTKLNADPLYLRLAFRTMPQLLLCHLSLHSHSISTITKVGAFGVSFLPQEVTIKRLYGTVP